MTRLRRSRTTLDLVTDPGPPGDWEGLASCARTPPALADFFGKYRADWSASKVICRGCPVRRDCLTYVLSARYVTGVWGALDPRELRFYLGLDAHGEPWTYAYTIVKCPYCRGATKSEQLSPVTAMRECVECGLQWVRCEVASARRRRNQRGVA